MGSGPHFWELIWLYLGITATLLFYDLLVKRLRTFNKSLNDGLGARAAQ